MPNFQRHVFVCMNQRADHAARPSCANVGGKTLKGALKDAARAAGLGKTVRINESGCLDQCEHGAVAVVYPEAVWYGFVKLEDVQEIVDEHLVGGRVVERLRLADACVNTAACPHRVSS